MTLEQPQEELSRDVATDQKLQDKLWFHLAAIVLVSLPVFFFLLGGWSFTDPDEGRYGSIPWQMLVRGDFVTPTQNGVKFFDKPPLLYWTIAASYAVFGLQEWAARLIPALSALAALFAVYALGRRMFSARAGLIGAVILATSLIWPILARIVLTDMLVSSLIFIAYALWWAGAFRDPTATTNDLFPEFLGGSRLAMLAKGPVVAVLVGGGFSCTRCGASN
jgi:4-amino-4-deoxy-L-arabinose transferase-like glycosyltransferase